MKIKISILGVITGILGFIASSTTWIYFKDVIPLIGTISIQIKLAPVQFYFLILFENLTTSKILFITGSILMLLFLNSFELSSRKSGRIIQIILFLIGIIGLIFNLLGLINFFTTILGEFNTSLQPSESSSIIPGLGLISGFLSLILGGIAIFAFLKQRGKLSKSFITLNIRRSLN